MNLETEINKIFGANTDYKNPSQAVNQARSIDALSSDLYTDSTRFIYELLQNADDSSLADQHTEAWIKTFDNYLVVAHSGKAFDNRDLRGICNINDGTKKSDLTKTGYKGIGFKSVFGQSEQVIIFTNGDYFRFDSSYTFDWKWDGSKQEWEQQNDRTFQFPWQIIPIYTKVKDASVLESIDSYLEKTKAKVATIIQLKHVDETKQAIQDLSQNLNMFLFLKNISKITFDLSSTVTVEIDRSEQHKVTLKQNGSPKTFWLTKTINLNVPANLKASLQEQSNIPEKLLSANCIELALAAKTEDDGITKLSKQERLLYSYLPTGETRYDLPVLVNTSFLTTANRESLHTDSKWNQWLFKNIAVEIFKWIAELVCSKFQYQAYNLIPDRTIDDELGKKFNEGRNKAIGSIPFVVTNNLGLIKVKEAIIDFTFLSEKHFIGKQPIKGFLIEKGTSSVSKFTANTGFGHDLKKLGATCFEWHDLKPFLLSRSFKKSHNKAKNIELIKYFKHLCESTPQDISIEKLKNLPFIYDHKNVINYPTQVCIPTANDTNWNNSNSELSFLHLELQNKLLQISNMRTWLEDLGVTEKTDITYIVQNILPNVTTYATKDNTIKVIQDLFNLYLKGDLKEELIRRLSKIRLLTQENSLLPAEKCFLSDFYKPRLEVENILNDENIFVNKAYYTQNKDEWKRFLKMLDVQEGVSVLTYPERSTSSDLIKAGLKKEYFESQDKKHTFYSTFIADQYTNFTTLNFINLTEDNDKFAVKFWEDVIENHTPNDVNLLTTSYWGRSGMDGRINGSEVGNYVVWFIKNVPCIPVCTNECKTSSSTLLNSDEIKGIAGNYLPVFKGTKLSQDWKAFFKFRKHLELSDYLDLLGKIAKDVDEKGKVRKENERRTQSIYSALLNQCTNWSDKDITTVKEWAKKGSLLNTKKQFTECSILKYFLDGNESIFQDQFEFLVIGAENKKHPELESLLGYFNVKILKESDFKLTPYQEKTCTNLINHLKGIIPYFKSWVNDEVNDDQTNQNLENIQSKINQLHIYEAKKLEITYESIDFTKSVNVHFDKSNLFVTTPWSSNSVLLKLPIVLCRYFYLLGHDKKLDFLLRSTVEEIKQYFVQENINIPEDIIDISPEIQASDKDIQPYKQSANAINEFNKAISDGKVPMEQFFHTSVADYEKLEYAKKIGMRAVYNVLEYLKKLPEYDCSRSDLITESIIRGITKNGNDITVVARPSDDNQVLLHYTSEYDVLEYVDTEFWCEDSINIPKQITFGQILKKTGINRIPIAIESIDMPDLATSLNSPKSEALDFDAVPFAPQKIARIIASFANTSGGELIFGLKKVNSTSNDIVGLSTDFKVDKIINEAVLLLSPTPDITHDWVKIGGKSVFIIKTKKSATDILLGGQKYIRQGEKSILEENTPTNVRTLNTPTFSKTIAIIIAIEDYSPREQDQIPTVKYAINDALEIKKVLINTLGVNEDDIDLITNEKALQNNLENDLGYIFYSLTENDRLIFYYAGHGFHDGVDNYLSTYDTHPFNIANTSVSLRKILLDPLKKSKCKNALIFIDACAQSLQNENERNYIVDINTEEFTLLNNDFPYYATFLSCQTGQSSYGSDIWENGIWTHHLIKAINGEVSDVIYNGKYITDRLLSDYLSSPMSVAADVKKENKRNKDQNPKAILDSSNETVIVEIEPKSTE